MIEPTPAPPMVASSAPPPTCSVCSVTRPDVSIVEVEDVVAAVAGSAAIPVCSDCAPLVAITRAPPAPVAAMTVNARCPFCCREVQATASRVLLGHPVDETKPRGDGCPGVGATVAPHCLI